MITVAEHPHAPGMTHDVAHGLGGPAQPILIVRDLSKYFLIRGQTRRRKDLVRAVDGVSFEVAKGETLGIVGESGCGKTTAARLLMHLTTPDQGTIILDGQQVGGGLSVRDLRHHVQMVFQDSFASLNPRLTIRDTVAFGVRANGESAAAARERADATLRMVGLAPESFSDRYPHELSGGQRQRVNIARALAMWPRVLILDEAVSALDKSVEAQVLNLLLELKDRLSLTYLFISHDLSVVRYVSDRVVIMYLGKIVEVGPVDIIYDTPQHPYTRALLASRLSMNPKERMARPPISGDPPNPINPPSGCRFRSRCPIAEDVCAQREPKLAALGTAHLAACHACDPGSGHSRATPVEPARAAS